MAASVANRLGGGSALFTQNESVQPLCEIFPGLGAAIEKGGTLGTYLAAQDPLFFMICCDANRSNRYKILPFLRHILEELAAANNPEMAKSFLSFVSIQLFVKPTLRPKDYTFIKEALEVFNDPSRLPFFIDIIKMSRWGMNTIDIYGLLRLDAESGLFSVKLAPLVREVLQIEGQHLKDAYQGSNRAVELETEQKYAALISRSRASQPPPGPNDTKV